MNLILNSNLNEFAHVGIKFFKMYSKLDLRPQTLLTSYILTFRRPLRKKLRMGWFFDVSEVKESSFLKSDLTDPPKILDAHLLVNTNLGPFRFPFSVSFI